MKKLCSKTHKFLINKLNRPVHVKKLHRKKLFVIYVVGILPNIRKVEIPCPHNKVALLMKRRSE